MDEAKRVELDALLAKLPGAIRSIRVEMRGESDAEHAAWTMARAAELLLEERDELLEEVEDLRLALSQARAHAAKADEALGRVSAEIRAVMGGSER